MAAIPTECAENQSSKYKNTHYVRDCNHTIHLSVFRLITPHAQRERGKVIGRGVHIYIYIYIYMSVVEKNI